LSRICLETCAAGKSGATLHNYPELPGSVYAEPYVALESTTGFVVADGESVLGYILCATDTRAFEAEASEWWKDVSQRFSSENPNPEYTSEDTRYLNLIKHMYTASDACVNFSPAHLHINLLPACQRQGWGRKLIGALVEQLRELGLDRVWLGMDPANMGASAFYKKLGFKRYEGMAENEAGLKFEDWAP
jgi:ribosomal protein S18 acetylase RimI-like enzyme